MATNTPNSTLSVNWSSALPLILTGLDGAPRGEHPIFFCPCLYQGEEVGGGSKGEECRGEGSFQLGGRN